MMMDQHNKKFTIRLMTRYYPCVILNCYIVETALTGETLIPNQPSWVWEVPSGSFIIGRNPDNAHITLEHASVSRQHARFDVMSDSIIIQDMDSANGLWVNNHRINNIKILNSDRFLPDIYLGYILIKINIPVVSLHVPAGFVRPTMPMKIAHNENDPLNQNTVRVPKAKKENHQPLPPSPSVDSNKPIHWQELSRQETSKKPWNFPFMR